MSKTCEYYLYSINWKDLYHPLDEYMFIGRLFSNIDKVISIIPIMIKVSNEWHNFNYNFNISRVYSPYPHIFTENKNKHIPCKVINGLISDLILINEIPDTNKILYTLD